MNNTRLCMICVSADTRLLGSTEEMNFAIPEIKHFFSH